MTDQAETATLVIETIEGTAAGHEPTPESGESPEARITRMEAALKKANHEAAASRKRLEAFEKAEQERKQAEMTELERVQQKAAQLEAELSALQLKDYQRQASKEAGIPADLAERLWGATLDELKADADELAKLLPKSAKAPPSVPATNPGGNATGKGETDAERRRRLLG